MFKEKKNKTSTKADPDFVSSSLNFLYSKQTDFVTSFLCDDLELETLH